MPVWAYQPPSAVLILCISYKPFVLGFLMATNSLFGALADADLSASVYIIFIYGVHVHKSAHTPTLGMHSFLAGTAVAERSCTYYLW